MLGGELQALPPLPHELSFFHEYGGHPGRYGATILVQLIIIMIKDTLLNTIILIVTLR